MDKSKRNEEILDYVRTHSYKETALKFNVCSATVGKIVKQFGLELKKSRCDGLTLTIDYDYFKDIDSERKAYWLGFICADGYISKDHKFSIMTKDLEILEKFKKDIKSEHKISIINSYDRRTDKTYTKYSIQIRNEKFILNLLQWVNHNKTDILNFPKIDEKYYSYFIAGLFDGDGSVYLKSNGTSTRLYANLISTKDVLTFINNYLLNFGCVEHPLYRVTENKDNVYKIYFYTDAVKFLDYIYSGDPTIYLSRKYNLYVENKLLKPTRNRIQPVLQYDNAGRFISKFNSQKAANLAIGSINGVCTASKHGTKCGGFYWVPFNNEDVVFNKIDIKKWNQLKQIVDVI